MKVRIGSFLTFVSSAVYSVSVEPRLRREVLDRSWSGGDARPGAVDIPGQQFGDAVDRVVGDAAEHVTQVGFGIEAVQFGRLDQRVYRCGALAAAIGAGEDPILSAEGEGPDGTLGGIVRDFEAAVCEIPGQRLPA